MPGLQINPSGAAANSEMTRYLVAVAEARDKNAFSHLFSHYAPRIKSYLKSRGANDASAEELSQEAMAAVWHKADRYDSSKAAASTWIFALARNLSIDAFRKEKRPAFDPEDPAFIPDPETAPDTALSVSETQSIVRDAIVGLPKEQAEVVRLSFYQDMTHREIAMELKLPLGTVKSRLRLSIRKLRESFGAEHQN